MLITDCLPCGFQFRFNIDTRTSFILLHGTTLRLQHTHIKHDCDALLDVFGGWLDGLLLLVFLSHGRDELQTLIPWNAVLVKEVAPQRVDVRSSTDEVDRFVSTTLAILVLVVEGVELSA
jgi:hypothetical protein